MNRFFVVAASRNLYGLVIAIFILAAALLPVVTVQVQALEPDLHGRSFIATLDADELTQYLRTQKRYMRVVENLGESVIQDMGTDRVDQVSFISAPLLWGASASVSARVEPVDVDRLRVLTNEERYVGVDGAVRLGTTGALRIGYDVAQWQDAGGTKTATGADAGVEYSLNDRTRFEAGYNIDWDATGTTATANVDVGYTITKGAQLRAGYRLINFSDANSREYKANVARANLTLRF